MEKLLGYNYLEFINYMELFEQNLAYLKRYFPNPFYNRICSKKLSQISEFQSSFYGEHAEGKCYKQVDLFLQHPAHLSLSFSTNTYEYTHQLCINNLNSIADNLGRKSNSKPQRGTLIVLGLGAGYHIPKLLSKIRYTDVIVVESSAEHYAMACQHINFAALHAECESRAGSINFFNIESYDQFLSEMKGLIDQNGVHLLSDISLYRHYSTPLTDQIFSEFKQWRNSFASMWGFLEDELLGLKHTSENRLNSTVSCHENVFSEFESFPVVIVGNGPSLDKSIDELKKQSDHAFIVSCGTSLAPLMKAGIKPDFHIEMERTSVNFEIKEAELVDPSNKDVVLIALSTVYPKLLTQFDNRIVFAKGNDLGAELANLSGDGCKALYHCNPTVTNMAVASFIRMGFKNIILLGCDYGYVDHQKHHSQLSSYYEPTNLLSNVNFDNEMKVKGNFRPFVYTSRIFNEARAAQERLLGYNPSATVTNTSDGAHIKGTQVANFEDLKFDKKSKYKLMPTVVAYASTHSGSQLNVGEYFNDACDKLRILKAQVGGADSITEVKGQLNRFIYELRKERQSFVYQLLLCGSIKYIVATIASHINHLPLNVWSDYDVKVRIELSAMLDKLIYELTLQ
ncbi:motility associated factor glycosyltransferase family protein [Pseudoalteromonas luteoviolacea]|uniref:Motility associated factor glycosyltransferase family protein n=1 Tax=Pseudoalteromonas luteoviolacea (strain 2ta16) TaxID=1353533 RepID=V4HB58_PSEL2|nr:6-hydroxymethylpterin diphosphokinase MptE-like protein [Pseudoalteromonas luteoviolacea]ESP94716.1 hypothetical protein PL2TA16_00716 [Pseudoalteromonas luteoviolacea 2ta16]KZN43420.1 hypothetical protein N483_08990 [Pseudoalteromonas luteoviolacea NCIMB 1944]